MAVKLMSVDRSARFDQGDALIRATQACRLAGVSYRMMDYWCRTDTIAPAVAARGSGTVRQFTLDQVATLRVFKQLSGYGAEQDTLRRVGRHLAEYPMLWEGVALVDRRGRLAVFDRREVFEAAWVVDLAACWEHVTVDLQEQAS